jgi:hypothetical protein
LVLNSIRCRIVMPGHLKPIFRIWKVRSVSLPLTTAQLVCPAISCSTQAGLPWYPHQGRASALQYSRVSSCHARARNCSVSQRSQAVMMSDRGSRQEIAWYAYFSPICRKWPYPQLDPPKGW